MKIIKVYGKGSKSCQKYAPIFKKWTKDNPDIESESVNYKDSSLDLDWGIERLPVTILVDYLGKFVARKQGILSEEDIDNFLDENPGD